MAIFNSFFYVYQRVRHPARSPSSMRCSVPQFCKGKLAFLHRQRLRRSSGSAYAHNIYIYICMIYIYMYDIYIYVWYIYIYICILYIYTLYYYDNDDYYYILLIYIYIYISPQGLWTEFAQSCSRTSGIIPAKLLGGFNQPLWKILYSQLGLWNSQYMEK